MVAESITQAEGAQIDSPVGGNALDPRIAFMRGEGCMLYTDVNAQMLGVIGSQAIKPLKGRHTNYDIGGPAKLSQSGAVLYEVTRLIMSGVPMPGDTGKFNFYKELSVSKEDRDSVGDKAFSLGFGDVNFPWHFSAGLASSVIHDFVGKGKITSDQADKLTLYDWANVIGSGWFSELVHSMAFTANGSWGDFGRHGFQYAEGALATHMVGRVALAPAIASVDDLELFDVHEEPFDGFTYLTASLRPDIRMMLRKSMRDDERKSTGCPVARKAVRMPVAEVATNSHIQNLIQLGIVTVRQAPGDKVIIEQEYTAIDRTLAFFADQLDNYADQHGQPVMHVRTVPLEHIKVTHEVKPPTNALRREG